MIARDWFRESPPGEDYEKSLIDARRDEPSYVKWTINPEPEDRYWNMPCGCRGYYVKRHGKEFARGRLTIPRKMSRAKGEKDWTPARPWLPTRWAPTARTGLLWQLVERHGSSDEYVTWRPLRWLRIKGGWEAYPFYGDRYATRDRQIDCPTCGATGVLRGRPREHYVKRGKRTPEIDPWTTAAELDYTPEAAAQTTYSASAARVNAAADLWRERPQLDGMPTWLRLQGSFGELADAAAEFERWKTRIDRPDLRLRSKIGLCFLALRMPERVLVPRMLLDLEQRQLEILRRVRGNNAPQGVLKKRDDEIRKLIAKGRTQQQVAVLFNVSNRHVRNIVNGRNDRPLGQHGDARYVKQPTPSERVSVARYEAELRAGTWKPSGRSEVGPYLELSEWPKDPGTGKPRFWGGTTCPLYV